MSELVLPKGWTQVSFDDVLENISNGVGGKQNQNGIGLPVSRIETIANESFDFNRIGFIEEPDKKDVSKYRLNVGDILFSHINSAKHLGKTAIFKNGELYHGINLLRLEVNKSITTPEFFNYFCNYLRANGYFSLNAKHAVNQASINQKALKTAPIVLPSLAEQKKISHTLELYLTTVSQIQARLDTIPKLIEKFRQSVIRDAVSGELVNYKSELNKVDTISLEEVVVSSMNGLSKRSGDSGEAEVVLRLADFKDAKRVYGGERKIRLTPKELEKYRINNEDILIVRVNGSVDLAGKFILYKEEDHPEAFCDHFIKLTLDSDRVRPEFVVLIANEGEGRYYLKNSLSTSAGQNTINQKSVKGLELKLPPLEIQDKIIQKVDFLFSFADQIEKSVAIAKAQVDNLTQSILHQAFTGQLTKEWREQNPELISGDNSTEVLLAKIEAEKKASGKKGKAKK